MTKDPDLIGREFGGKHYTTLTHPTAAECQSTTSDYLMRSKHNTYNPGNRRQTVRTPACHRRTALPAQNSVDERGAAQDMNHD
jgi:hypothetical protein